MKFPPIKTSLSITTLLLTSGGLTVTASAQTPINASPFTPYVTDLQGPRGLTFGPAGKLYVAEGGAGSNSSGL